MADGGEQPKAADEMATPAKGDHRYRLLALVVPLGVVIDQVAKHIANAHLMLGRPVPVIHGFFELRYSRNPGAFFSLGAGLDPTFRRVFFVVATLGAVALIAHLYRRSRPAQRALRWGLALLLAGAFGNLVDRALYGQVTDFLHLHFREVFHWATFNVADIYICSGLILLVADMLRPAPVPAPAPDERDAEAEAT